MSARYVDEERVREAEKDLLDGLSATRLAEVFKALSDPTRLRIISVLGHRELCVYDIAAALGMSHSAISHQLRTLRNLRLVKNRRNGRMVYYSVDDDHILSLYHQGRDHMNHE